MTELNQLGVARLLHFHKGVLQYHVAEIYLQKLQYVQKGKFLYVTKKGRYIDTKCDDEESILLLLYKNSFTLYNKDVGKGDNEGGVRKLNQGKIIEIFLYVGKVVFGEFS